MWPAPSLAHSSRDAGGAREVSTPSQTRSRTPGSVGRRRFRRLDSEPDTEPDTGSEGRSAIPGGATAQGGAVVVLAHQGEQRRDQPARGERQQKGGGERHRD